MSLEDDKWPVCSEDGAELLKTTCACSTTTFGGKDKDAALLLFFALKLLVFADFPSCCCCFLGLHFSRVVGLGCAGWVWVCWVVVVAVVVIVQWTGNGDDVDLQFEK